MILGKSSTIHSVSHLLGVLERAQKSVVRITIGAEKKNFCTGFFILRDLVVVPAFALDADIASLNVEGFRAGERVWQRRIKAPVEFLEPGGEPIPELWTSKGGALLALLPVDPRRGRKSKAGDADGDDVLELAQQTPQTGHFVAIPQYARGGSQLGISFGVLAAVNDTILNYNADTEGGSSGGPVLNDEWRLAGIHFASSHSRTTNEGITRAALIASLRTSARWEEIKERHRLADVAAAKEHATRIVPSSAKPERPHPAVIRAALRAAVAKASLPVQEASILAPYVVDPEAERWVLRPSERTRVLRLVGSLAELKKFAPADPDGGALQRVVNRALDGPPYDLASADEEALAWWIQVSRWFAGLHPDMPTPAAVTRVLERKRTRGRLEAIAGKDFRGRKSDLQKLSQWWSQSSQPLSLTGIGGIGKSALIARFASQLPESTLLLWLDFDRADLAPDDAPSVLSAIARQASVQLENFEEPAIDAERWLKASQLLGGRMHEALPPDAAALLVLDSFEAAQYAERYQELWPVLEAIAGAFPRLRVVVTGRAPVSDLRIAGHDAKGIHLLGLAREDAADWLRDRGVTDADVLARVLDMADGVPLILRMALSFLERGGTMAELPEQLSADIVAGFLYDRILNRVQNPAFKPVAMAALVLRRLSADMIEPVFRGLAELPPGDVATWFPELAREMALVEGTDVLRLRSEVRVPALRLLEKDQPELAKAVELSVMQWYRTPEHLQDPELAAELVYHCLRSGDEAGAARAWRDDCRKFLQDVGTDLPKRGHAWLRAHGVGAMQSESPEATLLVWELDAAERIRDARSRGNARVVRKILRERKKRSDASPLPFHEAYELWSEGDVPSASKVLDAAGNTQGSAGRDRKVLRALLFYAAGNAAEADDVLATVEGEAHWADWQHSIHSLAVRAARVRLATDLDAECAYLWSSKSHRLSPMDVVLPRLREMLGAQQIALEALTAIEELDAFEPDMIQSYMVSRRRPPDFTDSMSKYLTGLAEKRWWLATSSNFLGNTYLLVSKAEPTPLVDAIAGTLALFAATVEIGSGETVRITGPNGPLLDVVTQCEPAQPFASHSPNRQQYIVRILREGIYLSYQWESLLRHLDQVSILPSEQRAVVLHLLSPNPLEELVHELARHSR